MLQWHQFDSTSEKGYPMATYEKAIKYDRETRDYACYLDGELVGFARNYHAGEIMLDQLVFYLLAHFPKPPSAPLDVDFAPSSPEV